MTDQQELIRLIKFLDTALDGFEFESEVPKKFHTDLKEAFDQIIKPTAREIYKQLENGTNKS